MADFTLSKPIFGGKQPKTSTAGNIAYALFVLFCFWAGSQLLNILVHAPGVYEHLMQVQDNGRPRVEIGFGVSTLFGLIPLGADTKTIPLRNVASVDTSTKRAAPTSPATRAACSVPSTLVRSASISLCASISGTCL